MKSGVGLCVLGLLCLHSSVSGQEAIVVEPGTLVFCDDPSVEKAVHNAVDKFNERMSTGHKLALYQILTASKSENGSDSVYSLQFTSRRSDCLAGSNKHWTDCDYLPSQRKRPISCNATVSMSQTETETKQVDCVLDYILPERASCMGCPEKIDENSDDLRVPVTVSISKYNSISNSTHLFRLHSIGHATRQVVAGFRYKVRFDMQKTICAKAEHTELNKMCVPDEEDVEFVNCNSTVDVAPWRLEPPQAHLECEAGALSPVILRRRPPGWSPLRNILYEVDHTAPAPAPTPTPTKPSVKEESSEEDMTAAKPAASPFHCPTKPWKPFHPMPPAAAPTEAPVELGSVQPAIKGFSDQDLLA